MKTGKRRGDRVTASNHIAKMIKNGSKVVNGVPLKSLLLLHSRIDGVARKHGALHIQEGDDTDADTVVDVV
jgi:hypothetical protein